MHPDVTQHRGRALGRVLLYSEGHAIAPIHPHRPDASRPTQQLQAAPCGKLREIELRQNLIDHRSNVRGKLLVGSVEARQPPEVMDAERHTLPLQRRDQVRRVVEGLRQRLLAVGVVLHDGPAQRLQRASELAKRVGLAGHSLREVASQAGI